MKSRHSSLRIRPVTGQRACVRVAAAAGVAGVDAVGICSYPSTHAMHLAAASKRLQSRFFENDDPMHPGEGSA